MKMAQLATQYNAGTTKIVSGCQLCKIIGEDENDVCSFKICNNKNLVGKLVLASLIILDLVLNFIRIFL